VLGLGGGGVGGVTGLLGYVGGLGAAAHQLPAAAAGGLGGLLWPPAGAAIAGGGALQGVTGLPPVNSQAGALFTTPALGPGWATLATLQSAGLQQVFPHD
jgi:hypothetical protein